MRTSEHTNTSTETTGRRIRRLAGSLAVGTLILGSAGVAIASVAGAAEIGSSRTVVADPPSTWQAIYAGCMHASGNTADAMERHAESCAERANDFFTSPAYVGCVRGMSADTAERWSATCAERVLTTGG